MRRTQIEGNHWWVLCDVRRIIGYRNSHDFSNKLIDDKKKIIVVKYENTYGASRLLIINELALYELLNRSGRPEAEDFKHWLTNEVGVVFTESHVDVQGKVSIQASLQKAQMLIRIAENKAVPHSEQRRLLDMAVQELTGAGLNTNEVLSIRQSIEKIGRADITDLPEVVGFIHEKKTIDVNGCLIDFLPADMMALKWRTSHEKDKEFKGKAFSSLADDFGYKTPKYGFWQRVITPQGEAREFMYMDGTMLEYLYKKYPMSRKKNSPYHKYARQEIKKNNDFKNSIACRAFVVKRNFNKNNSARLCSQRKTLSLLNLCLRANSSTVKSGELFQIRQVRDKILCLRVYSPFYSCLSSYYYLLRKSMITTSTV